MQSDQVFDIRLVSNSFVSYWLFFPPYILLCSHFPLLFHYFSKTGQRVADKSETASNIAVIYEAGHIQTTSILEIAYICLKIPGSLGAALAG